jgi:hypothetical protein
MSDVLKIGTALAGGYLLGRTKKGKAAVGLALWLTGKGRPRDWVRQGVMSLAQTPEFQDLLKQARGPLLESAKGVAGSTLNSRLNSLADDLHRRTSALSAESDEDSQEGADESSESSQESDEGKEQQAQGDQDQGDKDQSDQGQGDKADSDQDQAEDSSSQESEKAADKSQSDEQSGQSDESEQQGDESDRSAGNRQSKDRQPPARKSA